MSSGCGVNHLISYLSTQGLGVSAHGSSTCRVTCRSTRCRCICNRSMLIDMWVVWCRSACNQPTNQTCGRRGVILHDILILLTAMWSTRCRRACNRSHAERHTGCHNLKEFLFVLRVVQGRTFRVRHAFEVPVTWKFDHGRRRGIVMMLLVSTMEFRVLGHIGWILGTRGYCRAVTIACLISNARMIRGKESYFAARKVARVCPQAARQRGCIKHDLYGEVARKHALSCDALLGLHVSILDVLARVPLWLRVSHSGFPREVSSDDYYCCYVIVRFRYGLKSLRPRSNGTVNSCSVTLTGSSLARHVALPDHGVGLDGHSCSCLIVGWPVGLSSPTLGLGRFVGLVLV
ncbi:hypothetical protein F2Q69_00042486 [Brassica cretica]|uniref:Uncharacterized protein n=1 Tax=Brassica cretica TaxID=69181 RepID=A0A8S9NUA6_BRACR|nr:hypothetical protein F2Q69_00042486 [Brassica cretica]